MMFAALFFLLFTFLIFGIFKGFEELYKFNYRTLDLEEIEGMGDDDVDVANFTSEEEALRYLRNVRNVLFGCVFVTSIIILLNSYN